MMKQFKKEVLIGIGSGLLMIILGIFVKSPVGMDETLSAILIICGLSLVVWGCWAYIKGKK